jgi:hypothetical protein
MVFKNLHGYRELSSAGHHVRVRNRWGEAVGFSGDTSADASLAASREAGYRRTTDRRTERDDIFSRNALVLDLK